MADSARQALILRGIRLSYVTIAYNSLEAIVSLVSGVMAGSVALVGFGIDSAIEVTASGAAQWRLRSDSNVARRGSAELTTLRIVGASFIALSVYVVADSARTIWLREAPNRSLSGIVVLILSVLVMPLLARSKRRVADQLGSGALRAEAKQTSLCAYLSVIALSGLLLNAVFGWWWADPVAALAMTPIIFKEGLEGLRGDRCADDCCS